MRWRQRNTAAALGWLTFTTYAPGIGARVAHSRRRERLTIRGLVLGGRGGRQEGEQGEAEQANTAHQGRRTR